MSVRHRASSLNNGNRYVMVDVETTGLFPSRGDRVIEIGAVRIERKQIKDEFHALINTGKRISPSAQLIHGITGRMLAGEPKPEDIFPLFSRFIHGSILVAHNARFDAGFLEQEFSRLGLVLRNRCLCTLEMSRERHPQLPNHKLKKYY